MRPRPSSCIKGHLCFKAAISRGYVFKEPDSFKIKFMRIRNTEKSRRAVYPVTVTNSFPFHYDPPVITLTSSGVPRTSYWAIVVHSIN